MERVCGHLQLDIVTVVGKAADLCQCSRPYKCFAVVFAVLRDLHHDVFQGAVVSEDFCCIHHCVHDLFVAGASAYIAVLLEPVPDFLSCGIRVFLQQLICGDYESRRTETALHSSCMHERHLYRVEEPGSADALDGQEFAVFFYPAYFSCTRADDFTVENHRT